MAATDPHTATCCLCGRVRFGAQWLAVPERVMRRLQLANGFCPTCLPRAMARVLDAFPRVKLLPQPDKAIVA